MLKTDYKDDIFDGVRKYRMVANNDGSTSLVDVTAYTQEGDLFGAEQLNAVGREVNGKAEYGHQHSWSELTEKPVTYPPSDHNHDNRYYTEAETNNLLNGKAAASHTHAAGQVTAGTLPAGVVAANGTDYGTSRLRNIRYGTAAPASLANGELFFVYE